MLDQTWQTLLTDKLPPGYLERVADFLDTIYQKETVYPPRDKVFSALNQTSLAAVKVVILGQDPYHGKGQAQGLAFSVPATVKAPPSLVNILRELEADIGKKDDHDLTSWAEQGVLLLNTCLTVPEGQANGHAGQIWEPFTDAVLGLVNQAPQPVVYILWGAAARKKKSLLTNPRHRLLEAAHPSPLSAYRGFFGSRPFSAANAYLDAAGSAPIDWLRTTQSQSREQ